ncbi:hypothetical protein V1521DRAFT_263055 [Lipomyces starkeyi]
MLMSLTSFSTRAEVRSVLEKMEGFVRIWSNAACGCGLQWLFGFPVRKRGRDGIFLLASQWPMMVAELESDGADRLSPQDMLDAVNSCLQLVDPNVCHV